MVFSYAWIVALIFLLLAFVVLFWTSKHNRVGNFNIMPELREGCRLITTGPYQFIRHPMYTSVVLIAIAALSYGFTLWKIGVFFCLVLILYLKASKEEKLWCNKTHEYKVYQDRTKMFIPFIL